MKTKELKGSLLDYWVAKAEGVPGDALDFVGGNKPESWEHVSIRGAGMFRPSTHWADGGPIIERERISVEPFKDTPAWSAFKFDTGDCEMSCETPLIAAMRCYVASKFGDEVPDEIDN